MKPRYSVGDYDKQLTLKVELNLWFTLLFLLSPFVVPILSIVNRRDTTQLINLVYPDRLDMALAAIAAIPAGFIIYAFIAKKPDATDLVRRIWLNGRRILILSAVLKIITLFVPYMTQMRSNVDWIGWLQAAISISIILYLYFSPRVKDTFMDFPQEHPEEK